MNEQLYGANVPETEYQKLSDVEGFTVVIRTNKRHRTHLLRAYESCNVDDAVKKDRFIGSREDLVVKYGRTIPCQRCFPGPTNEERALQADSPQSEVSVTDLEQLANEAEIDLESLPEGYSDTKIGTEEAEG